VVKINESIKIENESRYYLPSREFNSLFELAIKIGLKFKGKFFETTVMYDNPNPEKSFYSKEIDGRLRLRTGFITYDDVKLHKSRLKEDYAKLSWKRRLPKSNSPIRQEEEIEVEFTPKYAESMRAILENVLKAEVVSSYERYRTIFEGNKIELAIDIFPYGVMVEIEAKNGGIIDDVIYWTKKMGFKISNSSLLSCDDKYVELCNKNSILPKRHILFSDIEMPKI